MGSRRSDRYTPPITATPYSLSEEARGGPVVYGEPLPVRAWVQLPDLAVRIDAIVVGRTEDAVLVRWQQNGVDVEAWVWRAAVKHRTLDARS